MHTSTHDDHRPKSTDSEYVTNWKAVATFLGLMVFLLGVASLGVAMRMSDSGSSSNHSEATDTASDKPSNYNFRDNRGVVAEIDASSLVPWRRIQEKIPVLSTRTDLGDVNLAVDDEALPPLAGEEPKVADEPDLDADNVLAAYIDTYEWELLADLEERSVELDFESVKGSTKEALARTEGGEQLRLLLLAKRTDLRGIPFRELADCKKHVEAATSMQEMSTTIGRVVTNIRTKRSVEGESAYEEFAAEDRLVSLLERSDRWRRPEYVSTLVQMLQVGSVTARLQLVRMLADVRGEEATVALAERAIFDISPEVRTSAIESLKRRQSDDYRRRFLEGIRYPWPAVSVYAAQALIALNDQESVAKLVAFLDKPDPNAPFVDQEGKWLKRELVRVNHMRNCVLCHASSRSQRDLVRGLVPTPGKRIPVAYYQSGKGNFVRADITYLKQDFSLKLPVANADPWPDVQRFDYFVREREATPEEIAVVKSDEEVALHGKAVESSPYVQREAVLMALRKLTGENPGDTSENWRTLLASPGD